MKKSQLIALTAVTTLLAAGATIWLVRRAKHKKRLDSVANAGYEYAYDVHFPVKYKRYSN